MIERYVAFLGRWRWGVTAAWLAGLVLAGVVSAPLAGHLSGGGWSVPGSESAAVADSLRTGFEGRGSSDVTVVVHDKRYAADDPLFEERVSQVLDEVGADAGLQVESRVGYTTTEGELRDGFVGESGHTAIEQLGLRVRDGEARQLLPEVQQRLSAEFAGEGLEVSLVGTAAFWGEVNRLSEEGLMHAELLVLPLLLLVLTWIFRGAVAALAALAVAVTAILATFGVLTPVAAHTELSLFVQNTATMLGLGIGVDYSLFVIARFKEELARGRSVDDALATTLRTAGETVVMSGVTVVAAMSTLFLVPLGVTASIALGAVVVVGFSVLAAVVVLPVLLRLLGHRIGALGLPGRPRPRSGRHRTAQTSVWARTTRQVMRRPVAFLVAGCALLIALAAPATAMTTFTPDASIVPTSSPVRQGYDRVAEEFGPGTAAPIRVLVQAEAPLTGQAASDAVSGLAERLAELPGVERVDSALPALARLAPRQPLAALTRRDVLPAAVASLVGHYVSEDSTRLVLEVVPAGTAADPATVDLLQAVRAETATLGTAGVAALVGGETAEGVESNDLIGDRLPWVVGAMLLVIYLLLMLTFRSLLLPLKAILMNLVSVAATFGVLRLAFQTETGATLLGLDGPASIQNFVPVLLLVLLFSLSTDYEVFLLSRVREHWLRSRDTGASVESGMVSTAPLISGAALLMVLVFGAFAAAGILPIKQLGFGLAVAIAIDATLVRLVLVPASMRLMGALNWWLPRLPAHPRPALIPLETP